MQKFGQTIALVVVSVSLSVLMVACGGEDKSSDESEKKQSTNAENDAVYAASLTYVKDAFCDCVSAGNEISDCESEANDGLADISTEYALDDETEKDMYVQAGELMRSCIK